MASFKVTSLYLTGKQRRRQSNNEAKKIERNPFHPISVALKVVHSVVKALHDGTSEQLGIEVSTVFKGGSLKHGTAVPGNYDIDLVLYSRSLKYKEGIKDNGYHEILEKINDYFEEALSPNYTRIPLEGDLKKRGIPDVMLRFTHKLEGGGTLDVDLLLSPHWESKEDFFEALRGMTDEQRRIFSCSTSKWQSEFIKYQHQQVKELIQRAKAWRNVTWPGNEKEGKPISYLISLLVITAYNRVPVAAREKRLKKYAQVVTIKMKQLVKEITQDKDLDLSIPGADESLKTTYTDLLPNPPCITDPVNPANNLYQSGIKGPKDKRWSIFAEKVDTIDLTVTAKVIMERSKTHVQLKQEPEITKD